MADRTILLVDRDPLQRQLVDMLLAEDGYRIVNAGTGREALEFLKENTPHLVLMEIGLPDIGGDVVCRKLKSVSRLSGVPVILTSQATTRAGTSTDLKDVARAVHADLYLPKPLGDKNLRERTRDLLRRWDKPQAPPRTSMKNTVILEEALVELEAGSPDGAPPDAMTATLYQENEELRREVASLKRRLARAEAGASGRDGGPEGIVRGKEPASPQAPVAAAAGAPGPDGAAAMATTEADPEKAATEAAPTADAESRIRDLERRNKALLAALEEAKAELESTPRGLFGRRRR